METEKKSEQEQSKTGDKAYTHTILPNEEKP